MTKEQLQNSLDNYKRLYEVEKEKNEKLENEKEEINNYKALNLDLQLRVKWLEKENKELTNYNQILSSRNETYEKVFDILKADKAD